MRDNLLGYLLGALDGPEQEATEKQLKRDPKLQRDLQVLEAHLAALDAERWQLDPPPGLAQRTCEIVFRHRRVAVLGRCQASWVASSVPGGAEPAGMASRTYSFADLVVAAGIFFAASTLLFPAIGQSRYQSQRVVCQDNLRATGDGLQQYSQRNGGYFPYVPVQGNLAAAGIYGPQLRDSGFLVDPGRLICPASIWAEQRSRFRVPTIDEVHQAVGVQLTRLQQMMGGSYCYTIGYVQDGRHHAVRNQGRRTYAISADTTPTGKGAHVLPRHGGCGSNVLFEDNHVECLSESVLVAGDRDDVFHNDQGRLEAGNHPDDSVVAPSATPPLPRYHARFVSDSQLTVPPTSR